MAAVSLGALAATACGSGVTGPSDVMGGAWTLRSMELTGASRFVPDDPTRFTVSFEADGVIGVRADCNSCGGSYTLRGNTLTVPGMACTLALCAIPQGGQFASLIEGQTTLVKEGDTLEIASPEGRLVLVR